MTVGSHAEVSDPTPPVAMVRAAAPVVTPFTADDRIAHEALAAHVDWLVGAGLDGLMVAGTTSEGALLEDDEILAALETVRSAAAGRAYLIASVGRIGTAATVRLATRALACGADGIAACVPYYFPLTPAQVERHYETLLGSLDGAPVLAYVIPSHTGNDLSAESFGRLLGLGLAGLKDSTGDIDRHLEYVSAARQAGVQAALFVGADPLVAAARAGGGTGSITALANVAPRLLRELHDCIDAGDAAGTAAAQQAVRSELDRLGEGSRAQVCKRALSRQLAIEGISYPERTRLPL